MNWSLRGQFVQALKPDTIQRDLIKPGIQPFFPQSRDSNVYAVEEMTHGKGLPCVETQRDGVIGAHGFLLFPDWPGLQARTNDTAETM